MPEELFFSCDLYDFDIFTKWWRGLLKAVCLNVSPNWAENGEWEQTEEWVVLYLPEDEAPHPGQAHEEVRDQSDGASL